MTNEMLIDAGYKRYSPEPYRECQTDLFQKCISDEYGKRYFINIERWDFTKYEIDGRVNVGYETTVQFNRKDGLTVNIEILNPDDIDAVEKIYAEEWDSGKYKYYEAFYGHEGEIEAEY